MAMSSSQRERRAVAPLISRAPRTVAPTRGTAYVIAPVIQYTPSNRSGAKAREATSTPPAPTSSAVHDAAMRSALASSRARKRRAASQARMTRAGTTRADHGPSDTVPMIVALDVKRPDHPVYCATWPPHHPCWVTMALYP